MNRPPALKDRHRRMLACFAAGVMVASAGAAPLWAAEAPAKSDAALDPDSVPRQVGGGSTVGGAAGIRVIPYAQPKIPPDAPRQMPRIGGVPDFSGIYWHEARTFQDPAPTSGIGPGFGTAPSALTLHPDEVTDRLGSRGDYRTPLLRPWAADLVKLFGDAEHASQPYYELCQKNNGIFVMWSLGNRGLQVVQTPARVYLFFGQDVVRIVHLNAKHPAGLAPSINGHSVGHFEGDVLVIDTTGFDGTGYSDRYGTPSSDRLHLVERMSLSRSAQLLEVDFWVDDPIVFTQPWRSVVTYPRGTKLGNERVCRETRIFGGERRRGV